MPTFSPLARNFLLEKSKLRARKSKFHEQESRNFEQESRNFVVKSRNFEQENRNFVQDKNIFFDNIFFQLSLVEISSKKKFLTRKSKTSSPRNSKISSEKTFL